MSIPLINFFHGFIGLLPKVKLQIDSYTETVSLVGQEMHLIVF